MKMQRFVRREAYLALASSIVCGISMFATSASAGVVDVTVGNNFFSPSAITINENDQVKWTWSSGSVPHSTTSDTGLWDSGIHTTPFEFTMTFPSAGSFPYRCTVHPSMRGTITVRATPGNTAPTITTQPQSQTVAPGANVTFSVAATGTAPLSYQWRFNGNNIAGATDASLTLNNVQTSDAGPYSVVVSNGAGSTTSSDATLTVESGGGSGNFAKGVYNGLFFDSAGVSQQSSGSFTLTTTTKGKFSGRLQSGNKRLPLSGQFDANGAAQKTISRRGLSPLEIALQLDPNDSDKITGTVSDGTFTANLSGDRAVFDARRNQAPQAGRYTMVISGSSDSASAPGGDSFGSVMVDKAGRVRLTGSLADGTRMSQLAVVSKDGNWPLYVPLYGGKGSILSWITFTATDTDDLGGDVVWIKPSVGRAKLYPQGFTLSTSAHGSAYQRGAGGAVLNFTDGELALTGGDLAGDVTSAVTISSRNRVAGEPGSKLSLTFTPSTGLFRGRIMNPATSKFVPFSGAVLQKQNVGLGWFQGTSQSGEVRLSPK